MPTPKKGDGSMDASRIKLDLVRPGDIQMSDVGRRVYLPFDPVDIDQANRRGGLTVNEIATAAMSRIPGNFPGELQRVDEILSEFEQTPPDQLLAFGPDEGDYYLVLTDESPDEVRSQNGQA